MEPVCFFETPNHNKRIMIGGIFYEKIVCMGPVVYDAAFCGSIGGSATGGTGI